jgi:hypothetical protein
MSPAISWSFPTKRQTLSSRIAELRVVELGELATAADFLRGPDRVFGCPGMQPKPLADVGLENDLCGKTRRGKGCQ